ncbi:hypothetical protein GCM10020331_017250 [Ectobacillus funiculus]
MSIRFLVIILMTTLLTLTTTPIEITDGLESLLSPFKRIGLPAHEIALMMSISLRFIPTLLEETEKNYEGAGIKRCRFRRRTH